MVLAPMVVDCNSMLSRGDLAVVTGGTGFIGSNLVKVLQNAGVRVRVYSRRFFKSSPTEMTAGLSSSDWFTGDICDAKALSSACSGASAVFHVSGVAHLSNKNTAEMERVNVQGTRNLANICAEACLPRLVYVSSALAANPNDSAYARSKQQAEDIMLGEQGLGSAGVHVTVLRPTNVYGRGMQGNIAAMIRLIQRRNLLPLPKLNNRLTLISVKDTCQAALLAATKPHKSGQIFTLTDGENYTPSLIESAVYASLQRKSPRWHSPRMLFFAGALVAEVLDKLGIRPNDFGLRTYRNLVADRPLSAPATIIQLGFTPSQTLYTTMPEIIELSS